MNDDASINDNAPKKYIGKDRFEARKQVLHDIEQDGFLDKTENYLHKSDSLKEGTCR